MKDSEFLELLNLYLDHEISAADAARLEAEVQANPKRREVYRQYCRMQKACKVLAADFQAEQHTVEKRVPVGLQRSSHSAWRTGFFAVGGVSLAAACMALLFVARSGRDKGAEIPQVLASASVPSQTALNGSARVANGGIVRGTAPADLAAAQRKTLISDPLVLSGIKQPGAVFVSSAKNDSDQLAWVRDFQLVSLQERNHLEQLRFENAPPTLRPEGRPLGGRTPAEADVEMTAFRFRK